LKQEFINDVYTLIPKLEEQTAIASFLDRKTAQIDQAIGIKEKQIELLKERRQILIHRAVTRGLNPNVKLKESAVEWIGEIPEHWEVKKIKYITTKIGSGVTPPGGGTTYLDSGIPLLRSQNVLFGKIELEGVAYISKKTHDSMSNSQVREGDVLLNITGGSIGRCHFVDFDFPLNVNQHVCIVRPSLEITTVYLNSLLASEVGQGQIWFFQQGGGREGLNFQAIKNFIIPLPPQAEQSKISDYIETTTSKFHTAISLKELEIEKLKEYKASLVDAAVTGKIKVG
jgi:type I restriction enzyme S subunit